MNRIRVPAPDLGPVAAVWLDGPEDAWVVSDDARTWWLTGVQPSDRVLLATLSGPAEDPHGVARALAEGLAGCDLPPDGSGVAPSTLRAVLRAHRVDAEPA